MYVKGGGTSRGWWSEKHVIIYENGSSGLKHLHDVGIHSKDLNATGEDWVTRAEVPPQSHPCLLFSLQKA